MDIDKIMFRLEKHNVIIKDNHFVYHLGNHGEVYINKDAIYLHPLLVLDLCEELSKKVSVFKNDIDVIVGPEKGGIILSQLVARQLTLWKGKEILAAFAEKTEDDNFFIGRGYDKHIKGKNILVVEDILTTGDSVKKVVNAIRNIGGYVVGVNALFNRGNVRIEDIGDVPDLRFLVGFNLKTYSEEECLNYGPCSKEIPINTEFGYGKKFLAR